MSYYKSFPRANLVRDWGELIKLDKQEVINLYEEWKTIDKENKEKRQEILKIRGEKVKEISDHLKSLGIEVYKYKRNSIFKEKNGHLAWFKKNIVDEIYRKYPSYTGYIPSAHMDKKEVDGVTLHNNQSPTNIVELHERLTHQYKRKIEEVKKVDKLLVKSIEYAAKNDIDIDDLSPDQIVSVVSEVAKDNYLEENLPDGSEVYLKHGCYECSTYIMGERRCSCGNRRISIVVEGDLIQGFYYYPEPF